MANTAQAIPIRRSALANVRKGIIDAPKRVLIYGAEKVGKSTFASGAPSPIFLGAESGTEQLDVDRAEPQTWAETLDWINEYATAEHPYKTIVIDPVNWLEALCWAHVCEKNGWTSIEDPGYGKGYAAAMDEWRLFASVLERCRIKRGMHILLVAHSQVKKFENPEGPGYERYEIAMHKSPAGLLKQWVDYVLFAQVETFTEVDKVSKRAKGYTSGRHVLRSSPSAAYDAGSRWTLPEDLLLSWEDFATAIQSASAKAATLTAQANALVAEIGDAKVTEFAAAYLEKNKTKVDRLTELVNGLTAKLNKKQENAK